MKTAPTREHRFRGLSTLRSYKIFMISLVMSMLVFASFSDRFWKSFWLVLGSTFKAWGPEKLPEYHQDSMRKLASKKEGSEEV